MEGYPVTPRERLQLVYELAFHPPRLHQFWNELRKQAEFDQNETRELLRDALSLHLALPERGFPSNRALRRVALYQAKSKAYGTESFIKNIARQLGVDVVPRVSKIPPGMIRDLKLPEFSHARAKRNVRG